jgi:uncharacterized protein (TIGR03083 family)
MDTVSPVSGQPNLPDPGPARAARLLLAERDALLPLLREIPEEAFGLPTACPGWSVRDVLAHCSSALTRAAEGTLHAFTPELNEADVDERRGWPLAGVLAELERGYEGAAPVITAAAPRLDGLALGEWVHGGDVRDPLGLPGAYAGAGFADACVLLAARARIRKTPLVEVTLPGAVLPLGVAAGGRPPAALRTDEATLVRLYAGRPADPARYRLTGAQPAELIVF